MFDVSLVKEEIVKGLCEFLRKWGKHNHGKCKIVSPRHVVEQKAKRKRCLVKESLFCFSLCSLYLSTHKKAKYI